MKILKIIYLVISSIFLIVLLSSCNVFKIKFREVSNNLFECFILVSSMDDDGIVFINWCNYFEDLLLVVFIDMVLYNN